VGKKTGKNPTDRGKLGTKRSVLTDGRGVPLSIVVAAANAHDVTLARETLDGIVVARSRPKGNRRQHLCLDKAYASNKVERLTGRRGYTAHIPTKRKKGEPQATQPRYSGAKARRWVNERTHSWFHRFRRILIRWEKKAVNYLAILHFAAAYYTFRQARVFG
jgi:putative transposase